MESAYQVFAYLPLKYKNPSDADYFVFLVHSVDQNHQAKNYHFAVVALHIIYMSIVYHYIYGIFLADKKQFEYVLIGFHNRLQVKELDNISWHSFSNENESTIFQFYRSVSIPKDQISNLKAPVKKRNDILHTNGIYLTSEGNFEELFQAYLKNLERIHKFCVVEFRKLFLRLLDEIKIDVESKEGAGNTFGRTSFRNSASIQQPFVLSQELMNQNTLKIKDIFTQHCKKGWKQKIEKPRYNESHAR